MPKPMTRKEFDKLFPDDDACLDHVMRVRCGDRFVCHKCKREAHYYRVAKRRCYECEFCGHQVYPTAGTPFEKTRTALRDWFFVMFLFTTTRNGVAAKEVQRQLGVTYKTAWRMCHLVRRYMGYVDGDAPLGGPGKPPVEIDKAFIGGRDKRPSKGDKTVVLGMAERMGGEVITRVIADRSANSVMPHILQWVRRGGRIATDEANAFLGLREEGYWHGTVRHSAKEYVRGPVHTNTIEAIWSIIKRTISGTHVWVSKKHLQTYLWEAEYRYNLRNQPHLMFPLLMLSFPRPSMAASSASRGEDGQSVA